MLLAYASPLIFIRWVEQLITFKILKKKIKKIKHLLQCTVINAWVNIALFVVVLYAEIFLSHNHKLFKLRR